MNKNKLLSLVIAFVLSTAGLVALAENTTPPATTPTAAAKKAAAKKKTMKLDFESDTVTGTYDTPDASFINSRRMIKYKELFNKRTNFIEEIESNKGLFNEYQK
ncbi:MAG: hypothetical protein ACXVAX_00405 [Pseudobdellovibrio sp.]